LFNFQGPCGSLPARRFAIVPSVFTPVNTFFEISSNYFSGNREKA